MNRVQKGALCTLIVSLFLILFGILLFTEIVILKNLFTSLHRFIALLLFSFMVPLFIFLRKKQSLVEVESDERDNLIIKRAILFSFVSVWIMLAAVCIIPRFIVGYTGAIPVWALSLINFAILLIAMFIYSAAVLIQYGWGIKEKNHE
jgi:magnesium-transporting ATPase (P-type)